MTYSFDIFDTCLVRKCGSPLNMLDVLSLRVFNEPVDEWVRQEFVVERRKAEDTTWNENPFGRLSDIYDAMDFSHSSLKSKDELVRIETELENELLTPVLKMRNHIEKIRSKGNHIIYISDMYLPESFILKKMKEFGFISDGDTLYVSCEVGKRKQDGSLFKYVKEKENLNYRKWKHVGDDRNNDCSVPKKLGIKTELVRWSYNPYPKLWRDNDYSLGFKYPSITAGLCRALSLKNEENTHRDFVLDVVAPFYCSWVYYVLEDANRKGIKRLYFCARDAYQIHKIALKMQHLFPNIGIEYVYMSRVALYKEDNDSAKIAYFEKIGLATKEDNIALVDTTTSGKTLAYLNEYLLSKGYKTLTGYYYLLWNKVSEAEHKLYNEKVFDAYIRHNRKASCLIDGGYVFIFENLFAYNITPKTIDYADASPCFTKDIGNEDIYYDDSVDWMSVHQDLLKQYCESYVQLGLYRYSNQIFNQIGIVTLASFFHNPSKYYIGVLENLMIKKKNGVVLPFIKRCGIISLFVIKKHDFYWHKGCIAYNMPIWLINLRGKIHRLRLRNNDY